MNVSADKKKSKNISNSIEMEANQNVKRKLDNNIPIEIKDTESEFDLFFTSCPNVACFVKMNDQLIQLIYLIESQILNFFLNAKIKLLV
jgi:hypothetical protein